MVDGQCRTRWLTLEEVAIDLGYSRSTVYRWAQRGMPWFPPVVRLHGGGIRVRTDDYEEWLRGLSESA